MPPPYQNPHYAVFAAIRHVPQPAIGSVPSKWVKRLDGKGLADFEPLPDYKLDRFEVREICRDRDKPVLFGYICAMAWGDQGDGPKKNNATTAWHHRECLVPKLTQLRDEEMTRGKAYKLFCGGNAVPCLGPSYFTKLLYFFSRKPNRYIMDQFTGKSMHLITGRRVMRMGKEAPTRQNTGKHYCEYCEEIDAIASDLKDSGDHIEQRLFSSDDGDWRRYVRANWKA